MIVSKFDNDSLLFVCDKEETMNIEDLVNYFSSAEISFDNVFQGVIATTNKNTIIESSHDCASIIIPLTGCAHFIMDDRSYKLNTGNVLHVGPGKVLCKEILSETKYSYILIHYRLLNIEQEEFPFFISNYLMEVDNQKKILQCALELADNFKSNDLYKKLKCKSLFLCLIVELIHTLKNNSQHHPTIDLEKIKSYIHQHYAESISINDIANNFGIKRRYLTTVFQRYLGTSPIEYLTACRIHKAQELLSFTEKQILEISKSVGYTDNLYFSRVFKKKTGMSPTEYRKYQSNLSIGKVNLD